MKKFASLVLTVVLLAAMLCVFAVPASAEGIISGDYKYTVNNDGTATITGYTGSGGEITIPETLDEYKVTAIGNDAFSNNKSLTKVTILENINRIGDGAFKGCRSMTTLTISKGVNSIGASAFMGCKKLATVTIPEGVKSIGASAFQGCEQMETLTISEGVNSIGASAFQGCKYLATVTIPEGVNSIGASAFQGCEALATVTIPESVESIGDNAFSGCSADLVIRVPSNPAAEEYAKKHSIVFFANGQCKHYGQHFTCDACHKSVTKSELLKAWGDDNLSTGSTLSEGSLTIICSVACLAVGFLVAMFIFKKKKPALAGGTDNTDEE